MDQLPFDPGEWTTLEAVPRVHGLPMDFIHAAIMTGTLSVRSIAGELLLRRAELQAMRLRLMADRGCDACE